MPSEALLEGPVPSEALLEGPPPFERSMKSPARRAGFSISPYIRLFFCILTALKGIAKHLIITL